MAVRELLEHYERLDFYETLLEMLGCAQMSRSQVEEHLVALSGVFDIAKTVVKPPYRFAEDISDHARPVAIGGSQELIESGYLSSRSYFLDGGNLFSVSGYPLTECAL